MASEIIENMVDKSYRNLVNRFRIGDDVLLKSYGNVGEVLLCEFVVDDTVICATKSLSKTNSASANNHGSIPELIPNNHKHKITTSKSELLLKKNKVGHIYDFLQTMDANLGELSSIKPEFLFQGFTEVKYYYLCKEISYQINEVFNGEVFDYLRDLEEYDRVYEEAMAIADKNACDQLDAGATDSTGPQVGPQLPEAKLPIKPTQKIRILSYINQGKPLSQEERKYNILSPWNFSLQIFKNEQEQINFDKLLQKMNEFYEYAMNSHYGHRMVLDFEKISKFKEGTVYNGVSGHHLGGGYGCNFGDEIGMGEEGEFDGCEGEVFGFRFGLGGFLFFFYFT